MLTCVNAGLFKKGSVSDKNLLRAGFQHITAGIIFQNIVLCLHLKVCMFLKCFCYVLFSTANYTFVCEPDAASRHRPPYKTITVSTAICLRLRYQYELGGLTPSANPSHKLTVHNTIVATALISPPNCI